MPCLWACLYSSAAPAREPWSVSATAGISNSAARAASAGIRHAPSRIEYSEWTWRWTNGASGTGVGLSQPLLTLGPGLGWTGVGEGEVRGVPARRSGRHRRRDHRFADADSGLGAPRGGRDPTPPACVPLRRLR